MTERTCNWTGCKTKIQVDTSIEDRNSMFVVAGWCAIHHKAFNIATEMEKKFCKDKGIDWPLGSLSYKKYKRQINTIHIKAGKQAEVKEMEAAR